MKNKIFWTEVNPPLLHHENFFTHILWMVVFSKKHNVYYQFFVDIKGVEEKKTISYRISKHLYFYQTTKNPIQKNIGNNFWEIYTKSKFISFAKFFKEEKDNLFVETIGDAIKILNFFVIKFFTQRS